MVIINSHKVVKFIDIINGKIKVGTKKKVRNHIEPLQPSTLASFPTWGSSAGANSVTLAGRKSKGILDKRKALFANLRKGLFFYFIICIWHGENL